MFAYRYVVFNATPQTPLFPAAAHTYSRRNALACAKFVLENSRIYNKTIEKQSLGIVNMSKADNATVEANEENSVSFNLSNSGLCKIFTRQPDADQTPHAAWGGPYLTDVFTILNIYVYILAEWDYLGGGN